MALITIPSIPEKGTEQEYVLNTTELFALVSEAYFTDQNNLKVINAIYKSKTSNQIELISFTPNGNSTLTSMAEFASTSRDEFELLNIVIVDQQNGRYKVGASEIPGVASYEISFSSGPVPAPQLTRVNFNSVQVPFGSSRNFTIVIWDATQSNIITNIVSEEAFDNFSGEISAQNIAFVFSGKVSANGLYAVTESNSSTGYIVITGPTGVTYTIQPEDFIASTSVL
jgi:hypothetical protein